MKKLKVYISSSWKNRDKVRELANLLKENDFGVFDFTNQKNRKHKICPPERFPEQFDPERHNYEQYMNCNEDWHNVVYENKNEIAHSDIIILLLPCGIDATADWAYGVGLNKYTVILGHPNKGERSPVHLWANMMIDSNNKSFVLRKLNFARNVIKHYEIIKHYEK